MNTGWVQRSDRSWVKYVDHMRVGQARLCETKHGEPKWRLYRCHKTGHWDKEYRTIPCPFDTAVEAMAYLDTIERIGI